MADQYQLEDEIGRLKAAKSNISNEQSYAKSERTKVENGFSRIRNWKGSTFRAVQDIDLKGKYNDWIWKWGWSDDGSINGVLDRINSEIGNKKGILDSILAELENVVN